MNVPLPFQAFQFDFARHLRDPRGYARPAGVPARGSRLYRELLRNNLEGFLLACFPVTRDVLGTPRWKRLVDAFFFDARCRTPYFREIPREFADWLARGTAVAAIPPWAHELAHYEWVELALDVMDAVPVPHDPTGDLMAGRPVMAPAAKNLAYAWPVHRIGRTWRPRKRRPTCLLAYRDEVGAVRFMELNAASARLVDLLATGTMTGAQACLRLAEELGHADAGALAGHGTRLLEQLREAGAVLGTAT